MKLMQIPAEIGLALVYPLTGSALLPEEKFMYGACLVIVAAFILGVAGLAVYQLS